MRKMFTLLVTSAFTASVLLTSCSSNNGDGGNNGTSTTGNEGTASELKTGITLKLTRPGFNDVHPASKDLWMWKKYEEMSGVKVNWEEIPGASVTERKNIIMASSDLPDAFYQLGFSQGEIAKYGQQGIFVPLDDLIDKYAPNIKQLFEEHPEIKQAVTAPDGKVYSLPYVDTSKAFASLRIYINKNWLNKVGLEQPQTIDEFYTALKAFKEQDANGNGKADETGWYMPAGSLSWTLERQLLGSFGMGNGGLKAAESWIYLDDQGEVQTVFNDPKYKEVWLYLKKLYTEGLLHPQTFTGVEYAQWVADGAKDLVGAYSWVGPNYLGDKVQDNFVGINALEGPNGDRIMNWLDNPARGISSFEITKANKYPAETIRWIDYFYGEEGSKFGTLGLEGETFNMVDGKPQYIDAIKNYEGGMQLGAFQYVDNVYGGYYPYVEPSEELRMGVKGTTVAEEINTDISELDKFAPAEIWPNFAPTEEESMEIDPIMTDIGKYIDEMRVKFITGKADIEAEWDNYVKTLDKMGAKRYLDIKRAQYDRFKGGK
ncbi:ABC transporter substrate-binding protein [Paenibacillus sp. GCM10023250]|uniref:ABC transporter substrate-binding protein n=1 Tax=Paenibacillus sp. GCM10023250 TaxID=3252648 RepID=UPI003610C306